MALFGTRAANLFRTRNPRRDRETDAARALRLRAFLDDFRAEIEREHEADGPGARDDHRTRAHCHATNAQEEPVPPSVR